VKTRLKDCAHIYLKADEQVTFITQAGAEYDVLRKSWGFYATPSLNNRLSGFGLHAALVKGHQTTYFLMLVENAKKKEFNRYLKSHRLTVIQWMHTTAQLEKLEKRRRL
jgi:hypothetical protein